MRTTKVFLTFFLIGIFFQSCEQKAVLTTLDEAEMLQVDELPPHEAPYHEGDLYFDYVQEYRYQGNVYTYEDQDKRPELANLLQREDITVFITKDLDELAAYEVEYANIALEDRDRALEPRDRIAYILDQEQEPDDFIDNYIEQVESIQGGTDIEERSICNSNYYSIKVILYDYSNYGGAQVVRYPSKPASQPFILYMPGWFNNRLSSLRLNVTRLPYNSNGYRLSIFDDYIGPWTCAYYAWNRTCQSHWRNISHVGGCHNKASSLILSVY